MKNKKKKVLLAATVGGFVPQFEMGNVEILKSLGYEVHYASNFNNLVYETADIILKNSDIVRHQIDFARSPFSVVENIVAYNQFRTLIKKENFAMIHCHTPMGGLIARLASRDTRFQGKMIYTAHGFHFYKDAPLMNWILFYLAEMWMANYTDALITINKEDYCHAKKFHLRKDGHLYYVPGVGIKLENGQSKPDPKWFTQKRRSLGLVQEDFILISVGELSKRKNHQIVIKTISKLISRYPQIKYLICGSGRKRSYLEKQIRELHLENNIFLLGYRNDIRDLLNISDCFIFPSLQEGLPVALMEAMARGLPVICSDIRGSTDLIAAQKGGLLVNKRDIGGYETAIGYMVEHPIEAERYGNWNLERIKGFGQQAVCSKMTKIYRTLLKSGEINE